jgi:hypothetical protein
MDPFSSRVLLEFEDVFRDEEDEEEEEDEDDVVFFELRVDLLEEAFLFILSSSSLWLFSGCVFAVVASRFWFFYRSGNWRGKNRVFRFLFRFFASAQQAKHHLLPTLPSHSITASPKPYHFPTFVFVVKISTTAETSATKAIPCNPASFLCQEQHVNNCNTKD